MDESPMDDDLEAEAPAPTEAKKDPHAGVPPEVVFEGLSTGKEPWRGSGCSSRLPLYGCVIGIAVLIGVLFAGAAMMRRTVWVNMERGRRVVVQRLPSELPLAERQRTIRNLERFRTLLDAIDDPYPVMGEFMKRVRDVLDDGRLTVDEVGGINVYLERVIEGSGVPPMQLGSQIRYSDFGIRNSQPPPHDPDGVSLLGPSLRTGNPHSQVELVIDFKARVGGWHSEFRIPNSEFV